MGKFKNYLKKLPILSKANHYLLYFSHNNDFLHEEVRQLRKDLNEANRQIATLQNKSVLNNAESKHKSVISKKSKIAVYTAIIGGYDYLNEPEIIEKDYFDYYCFTDNKNIKSKNWKIIYFDSNKYKELKGLDNRRIARFIKTHPHLLLKDYKHSLYMDANVVFKKKKSEWLNKHLAYEDMLVPIHPLRDCIYAEAEECIKAKLDDDYIINKQMSKYKDNYYPSHNGLIMSNVIYRKHNKTTNKINELWWNEILNYSKRDQLSFNYVTYTNNYKYDVSPLDSFNNEYYMCLSHYNCNYLRTYDYYRSVPDYAIKQEIEVWYRTIKQCDFDIDHPRNYNEKIQWLKVYDCLKEKALLSDKLELKEYIKKTLGEEYVLETYGIYDNFDEVDFKDLPKKFFLKTNHGSGNNVLVRGNDYYNPKNGAHYSFDELRKYFNDSLNINFAYMNGFEMQYRDIKPRIFAEEYFDYYKDKKFNEFKFICSKGEVLYIEEFQYVNNFSCTSLYSRDWQRQDWFYPSGKVNIPLRQKPKKLDEMIAIAEKLSKDFLLVRVDLYADETSIKVGEMTFTESSGIRKLSDEVNYKLGEKIVLPIK